MSRFLLIVILASGAIRAEVFCVQTDTELRQAVQTASTNGENDIIRIQTGTYPAPVQVPFIYSSDGAFDLELSGGWSPAFDGTPCIHNDDGPDETTLDGEGARPVMEIQGQAGEAGSVTIRNLSITSALADNVSAGLRIVGPASGFDGEVLVDRVRFSGNQGPTGGSALRITGGNKVTVRNCIFAFNSTGNGDGVAHASMAATDQGVYFINNTFTFGSHDDDPATSTTTSGLYINLNDDGTNQSRAYVANNLFWANETNDAWLGGVGTTYVYNNNFFFPEPPSDFSGGNLSVDPQLVQIGIDFTPGPGSPLIDQGRPQPTPPLPFPLPFNLDWSYGSVDFDGGAVPRVNGQAVDIGAVESPFRPDRMFQDRFEQ